MQVRQIARRAEMELGMFVRHASYAARGVALYSAGVMDKYDINCRKFNSYEMGNLAWATSLVLRWQAINGRSGRLFTALFLLATVIGIEILHHDLVLSRLFHRGQREFKMTQVMLIALDGISATLLCLFLFMKSPIIASAVNLMAFFILAVLLLAAEAHQLDIDVAQRAEQDRNGAYRALMQQLQGVEELRDYGQLLLTLDDFLVEREATPPEVVKRLPTYTKEGEGETADGECMICFSEYEEGEEIKVLPCFHKGHKECVEKWLHRKNTCPICQASVNHEGDFED